MSDEEIDFIIVDSHCHLDMLKDYDTVDNIINRAKESKVKYLQTICTKLHEFPNILEFAEKYDNVFASVGVHPSEVASSIDQEKLVALSRHKKVIAFGETGLDYFYNEEKIQQTQQREAFEIHINAACATQLPVIVHSRNAESDTYDMLAHSVKNHNLTGVIHCFTSNKDFASKMLDLGMYISISGIVTFKNAEELREVVNFIPIDRLLIETDSPYLAPVPKRGKTNEPSYTYYVAEYIANLRNISVAMLGNQTTDNFFRLFNKAHR